MSGTRWTPSQQAAIEHVDGALLVSAAAGSGKTAVLAARCVHLVCTAPKPCDVDQLLVLTFTRAAAGEMRERIEKALRDHIEQADDARLQRQLRLIDRAQITTLDGFCSSLVRANFHLLGIDPAFAILAPEDAALLKAEVVDRLLDVEYESSRSEALKGLLDGYFKSDDTALRTQLVTANALMQSIVDPDRWMADALRRLEGGADGSDRELFEQFGQMQQRSLRNTVRKLGIARRFAERHEGLEKYVGHIDELLLDAEKWLSLAVRGEFNTLASSVCSFKAPTLPRVAKDHPHKEVAQRLLNWAKDDLKSGGDANALCMWSKLQLQDDLGRISPHARYFLELTERFTAAYDRAKRDMRSLDFADTERLALSVLRDGQTMKPSESARLLHERFHHVLVDEFQDINPLQNAILRLISRDALAECEGGCRSNFFTVGDVKQSIYRFRLAEPQQFIDRQATLRTENTIGKVIDLQENFRSRGPLLEAVNDVFKLLMTAEASGIEYDESHELRSILPFPDLGLGAFAGKPIELHILPRELEYDPAAEDEEVTESFEREVALVAHRIRELIAERRVVAVKQGSELVSREIQYGDIAVLLRSARFKSSVIADELRSQGIPVHAEDTTGYFTNTEVQDVLCLLRLISNGKQDIPMAGFLRSPLAGIESPEDALAKIRLAHPDEPFHRAAVLYAGSQQDELAETLRALFERLAQWREVFQEQSIAESLSQLFDDTGYLTFCRALPDGAQRVANLQELQDRASAFDTFERQGLDRFLAFLEELEADDGLGRPAIAAASSNYVRVMTVHKSKGLEFPVVIVPDLGKKFNEQSLTSPVLLDRDLGIGMSAVDLEARVRYPSLASLVIKSHMRRQMVAEEIRVLYVALTRAREHLILIGSSDSTFDDFKQEWASHEGPLPDEAIQTARTALDWIGPIAALTERKGQGTFAVTDWHDQSLPTSGGETGFQTVQAQIQKWFKESRRTKGEVSEEGQALIERLRFVYPHLPATIERSTRRISDLVQSQTGERRTIELPWPSAYRPQQRASAVEIGSATHRFMEVFDPARAETRADIAQQVEELVAKRLLSERDAKLVNVEVVEWFLSTDLGSLMRRDGVRLLREQTIAFTIYLEGLDPSDCILVRGRMDALLQTPEGLILIDYKTDRVEPLFAESRASTYWPQVRGYAEAVHKVVKQPVVRASLVFLHARQIIDMPTHLLRTDVE